MRKLSYLIVLFGAAFFVHNTLAQQVQYNSKWNVLPYVSDIHESEFDAFGNAGNEVMFRGTDSNGAVHIGDFYSAGGKASHYVEKLTIDRFWVTSETIGTVKKFNADPGGQYGGVDIKKFILQVGAQEINVEGQRNFGRKHEELQKVILTDISVSDGTISQTKDKGGYATQWRLSGNFGIENYGTIENADVSGGTFGNAGTVKNLKYSGGIYNNKGGHINTLTLAASSDVKDWGEVDTLRFEGNGDGLITLTLTARINENRQLSFEGIDVKKTVNFASGQVMLDMTKVVAELLEESAASTYRLNEDWATRIRREFGNDAFTAARIFGIDHFDHEDQSYISVMRTTEQEQEEIPIVVAGKRAIGWQTESAPTPEPATLAVFGLGLAGLGMASYRRKKK